MIYKEQITTVTDFHSSKSKEKNSIFIGQVFPLESEIEFHKILEEVKRDLYDASHHCYAYRLKNDLFKYSDDGEPSGSAGVRILNAIEHFDLKDVLVIVNRYFGGTKLGIGPLGKAYFDSAFQVLNQAKKITKHAFLKIKLF
ncbi:MAG: YigZ family protein [Ignavibacteriaceae bacterium]